MFKILTSAADALALVAVVLVLFLLPFVHAADDSMTYIEYRVLAPSIKPGTFEGAVRKLWRYTDSYARVEEVPNPQTGIHGLLISNAPNSYLINRYNNVAQHIVDSGPTFNVIVPVFPSERSPQFKGLQMGRELAFLTSNGATEGSDETIDGVSYRVFVLKLEDSEIKLLLDKRTKQPRQLSIRNPRVQYALRYDAYRTDVPVDLTLFSVPQDVRIIRAN
ncbi:MAG TPA: hypothetical protein VFC14_01720 [Burkholderiales bacterium]|nr:hypothetical protein [Burkholderiales bacterium]